MSNGWTGGQYSLFRLFAGTYFFVGVALFARPVLALQSDPERFLLFPNLIDLPGSAAGAILLVALGATAALLFTLGWFERTSAVILIYVLACLVDARLLAAGRGVVGAGLVLAAQPFLPTAPFGSLAARGRLDPRGDWRLPGAVRLAVWDATALILAYHGLAGILGRDRFGGPSSIELYGEWIDVALGGGCLLLARIPAARPWLWSGLLAWALWLVAADPGWSACGMLLLVAFLFDPGWVRPAPARGVETVFYDGTCGLCHLAVRFVLAEDRGATPFRFATLQGEQFRELLRSPAPADGASTSDPAPPRSMPDSLVTLTGDGELLTRSTGVLHVLRRLGGLWRWMAAIVGFVPLVVRDRVYDLVARVRHRLMPRPDRGCPRVPDDLRTRFDFGSET